MKSFNNVTIGSKRCDFDETLEKNFNYPKW